MSKMLWEVRVKRRREAVDPEVLPVSIASDSVTPKGIN